MGESGAQYYDEWEDDTTAAFFGGLTATKGSFPSGHPQGTDTDYGTQDEEPVVMSSRIDGPRDLFGEEIVALVKNSVETTRKALQNSLANSGLTGDAAAQTKLTIQLKSQGFREFPEKAIEYLKADVERLVIAHNSIPLIPYKFGEMQSLTFLNVRANRLREFPKAFLRLSKLQMLDISRNQLANIPDDINQMKSLKVLSASGNSLNTLPASLGYLEALRILKIDANPLTERFRRMVEESGGFPSGSPQPPQQTQQELDMTTRLKELLRQEASSQESTGDSSESPLDTPRPLRRNNSIRFPVAVPGLSGSESTPDLTSPSSLRAGSLGKSHQRGVSGASTGYSSSRRPGVAPLLIANDRNRSNSEGLPQAGQPLRTKRVGLLSKKTQDAQADSNKFSRNSLHLRGVSHGSALKDRSGAGRPPARSNLSNGSSISELDMVPTDLVVRRLSSLPEADIPDLPGFSASEVQACKGLLFSLHQMHLNIGGQYNIVRQGGGKRSSLERVYYNATSHLENLDNAIFNMYNSAEEDDHVREDACRNTREGCKSCVVAYKQVIELLYQGADTYVAQTDPRFVRTFLHLLYASIIEAVNATANLKKMLDESNQSSADKSGPVPTKEATPKLTVRPTTPIKEKPKNISSSHSQNDSSRRIHHRYKTSTNPYPAVPLHLHQRSRAESHTTPGIMPPSTNSSVGTPRSGESFYIPNTPGLPTPAPDYNPMSAGADFTSQDIIFEQVHFAFVQASTPASAALRIVYERFRSQQKANIEGRGPRNRHEFLTRLVSRARYCQEACDALHARLAVVKLKDLEVRRASEFWGYCTRFVNSFVRLVDEVKATRAQLSVDSEVVRILKPIHLAVKTAVNTLSTSPWSHVLNTPSHSQAPSQVNSNAGSPSHSRAPSKDTPPTTHTIQYTNGTATTVPVERVRTQGLISPNVSSTNLNARGRGDSETSLSPYMPQTPLSAALGPAAQATIPTSLAANVQPGTPPKSSFDSSFKGGVFERADTLLRSQSVLGHRR